MLLLFLGLCSEIVNRIWVVVWEREICSMMTRAVGGLEIDWSLLSALVWSLWLIGLKAPTNCVPDMLLPTVDHPWFIGTLFPIVYSYFAVSYQVNFSKDSWPEVTRRRQSYIHSLLSTFCIYIQQIVFPWWSATDTEIKVLSPEH